MFIEKRMLAGDYASAQDVVCAGLRLLKARGEQHSDDFLPGEWDRLLAEAEGGEAMPLDDAIAKRRAERGSIRSSQ